MRICKRFLLQIERLDYIVRDGISHLFHLLDDLRILIYEFEPFVIRLIVPHASVFLRQILRWQVLMKALVITTMKEDSVSHFGVEQRLEDCKDRIEHPRLVEDVYRVCLDGKRSYH